MKKNILLICISLLCINLVFGQIPLEVEGQGSQKTGQIKSFATTQPSTFQVERTNDLNSNERLLELTMPKSSNDLGRFISATYDTGLRVFSVNADGSIVTEGNITLGAFSPGGDELTLNDFDGDGDAVIRTKQGPHELVFGSNVSNEGLIGTTTDSRFTFRTNNVTRAIISKEGNFGIGTPGPQKKLHVRDDGVLNGQTTVAVLESVVSKRPTLLFSEGGSALSNGMSIEYDGRNNGANNILSINTSAGNAGLTVRNGGSVGVRGTPSNLASLRINQESGVPRALEIANTVGGNFWGFTHASGLQLDYNGSLRGTFNDVNGNYTSVSDRRLKANIKPLADDALDKVMKLNPVSYTFKDQEGDNESIGFIAQEIEVLYPELVHQIESDNQDLLTLSYSEFGVIAIKAIQEQQLIIDELKNEINKFHSLKQDLISLKAELTSSLNGSDTKATK